MQQSEIDEISNAFSDAWQQYFGQEMYYVPLVTPVTTDDYYGDSKDKAYDLTNKVLFYGTFKESEVKETGYVAGNDEVINAEITCVTKELADKGITKIKSQDAIQITDKYGETHLYDIIGHFNKVQFGSTQIFTKISVTLIPYEELKGK